MTELTSVCVYCGSHKGANEEYERAAIALTDALVDRGIRLVNGGGSIGLMGVMADRVIELNGECIGVIPMSLKEREVAHHGMTELIVVPDMHSRKLTMVNLSDAFIAMPGGFGTLDELFETLTWLQLHLHQKPICLLNINGYFDPLITMADKMVAEKFLSVENRALLRVAGSVEDVFNVLDQPHDAPTVKWMT